MRGLILTTLLLSAAPAGAVTRDQVMTTAKAYVFHPWRCTSQNLTASCQASYTSVFPVGDYVGVPYDWGGEDTLFKFDQKLTQGYGAGTRPSDGVLSCTTGVDCSGFVSRCWDHPYKLGTYTLQDVSSAITQSQLLAGDVMNDPGNHVVLYSHALPSGEPVWYEAGYYVTEIDYGWSKVSGYTAWRYNQISGTTAGNPVGTLTNPIVIGSLPYSDSRDTTKSVSDVLDGCAAAPTKDESGPEYVYEVSFTQPGSLTVSVSCGTGVDIDVHLYGSASTNDCMARDNTSFTHPVDCGTYYVVADTYKQGAGPYTLTVSFSPSGGSCGSGPPTYDPPGELGDPCPTTTPDPTICNKTLGSEMCLYVKGGKSWCSKACATDADCTAAFPGGCCIDFTGKGEYYCVLSTYCGGPVTPDSGPVVVPDSGPVVAPDSGAPVTDSGGPVAGDSAVATEAGVLPGDGGALPSDGIAVGDAATGGGGGCSLGRRSLPAAGPLLLLLGLLLLGLRRSGQPR